MAGPGRVAERVRIIGRVQGVWFRGWVVDQARRRMLDGWVRNRTDGSVEAVFAGSADAVAAMVDACYTGPPMARVDDLVREPTDDPGATGFEQRPNA